MNSASQIERLLKCPGSNRLPQTETNNSYSTAGRERHAALEAIIKAGGVPDGIDPSLITFDAKTEVAFAFNVATFECRPVVLDAHRAYPDIGPFWLYGTADLVGTIDDTVIIIDWKSYERNTKASENMQLLTLAVMACKALGKSNAVVALAYGEGVEVSWTDKAAISEEALSYHAHYLRTLFAQSATIKELRPGSYCRYCPAFAHCPEQNQAALVPVEQAHIIPAENLWRNMQAAKLYAKRAYEVLFASIKDGALVMVDGKELKITKTEGKRGIKDGDAAYQIAKHYLDDEALEKIFSRHTTIGDLRKAKLPKGAFDEMEKAGAIAKSAGAEKLEIV